jgi:hypothetical protein
MPMQSVVLMAGVSSYAMAQNTQSDGGAAARAGAIAHAQKMLKLFPDVRGSAQKTPPVIPPLEIGADPGGAIASFHPNGPTITAKNAFFQDLGNTGAAAKPVINGRTAGRSAHVTRKSGFLLTRTNRCSA